MKIANIYPIANQKKYKKENYVMILAHLIDRYDSTNFDESQYIIMDNGLFEKSQVSTKLQDCIDLAEKSKIPVKEIIVPDAVNDTEKTIQLFEDSLETIKKWQHKYRFMFVAQATTYEELKKGFVFANLWVDRGLNISIGVSKLSPLDRASEDAIEIYKTSKAPIHFLGIKKTFDEIVSVAKYIRGTDTSQIAFMAKNNAHSSDVCTYVRDGEDIDLAVDNCSDTDLDKLFDQEQVDIEKHLMGFYY